VLYFLYCTSRYKKRDGIPVSFYSDKNSGSTVKLTLRDRLFGRKGGSGKQDSGLKNGRQDRTSTGPTRSLESNGYLRYGLAEGSDVYISTSIDDPFIDCDEPKPKKTGGRFLSRTIEETSEPNKMFKNALPEVKFTESDFEEKIIFRDESQHIVTPQTAVTSSIETATVEELNVIDFNEEPLYDIEPVDDEVSVPYTYVEDYEIDIERLPAAPVRVEPSQSESCEMEEIVEVSEPIFVLSLPPTLQYLEIAPPVVRLALPQSSQVPAVSAPATMFLLPEIIASDEEIDAAMEGTEESANAIIATLPSGLYVEGFEPTADAVSFEEEVISVNANCPSQVAETSSSVEEILVDYVDYVGYDFLPEVTDPIRREPRHCEPTISQMPEYVKIDDEISGMLLLTIPELASNVFEVVDSFSTREQEIPEDCMEALGISIDSARNAVNENIDIKSMIGDAFMAAVVLSETLFKEDVELELNETIDIDNMIGEAFRAATALSETLFEEDVKENILHTLTTEDKFEVSEMIRSFIESISEPEEKSEEILTEAPLEFLFTEEVRTIKPKMSFIFNNGAKTHSFY